MSREKPSMILLLLRDVRFDLLEWYAKNSLKKKNNGQHAQLKII
jgi:hypothetical protein